MGEPQLKQKHIRGWMTRMLLDEDSSLHAARHDSEADLVIILHTPRGGTSGQARLSSGTEEIDYQRSHAAVNWNHQAAFAHEVGHLFGAAHDEYRLDAVGSSPMADYGQGYVDTAQGFRTLMSYTTECDDEGVSCPRIPYFSNPHVMHDGSSVGNESSAYNACLIAQRGSYLVKFYEYWSGREPWSRHRLMRNCDTELSPLE